MADARRPNASSAHPSEGHESVPALDVPLSISHCPEDELLSWLQYPLEDSFDKNYCSEKPYPEAVAYHSDSVHNAFSNLTLRDATYTWSVPGVHDTKKGERVLVANMAMAMGAQRAAGLLSQSGADAFSKVRTNAQPHVATGVHNHVKEERSGSASNIPKARSLQLLCQNVSRPNFPLFSRAGVTTGMGSDDSPTVSHNVKSATYDASKASQRVKLGSIIHAGASSENQTERVFTPILQSKSLRLKNVEQSSALDTSMIIKDFPSLSLLQSRATEGTCVSFSSLPSKQPVKLETSNELTTDGSKFTRPNFVCSEFEAKAIGSMIHATETLRAPTSQYTKRALRSHSAPAAIIGLASGALAGSSCKTIRAEIKSKNQVSQEDPSFGSALTGITDMDLCKQSQLACCASKTNLNTIGSRNFSSTEDLGSKALCLVGTGSGITMSGSQLHETVGTGDAFTASPARAWGDITSKNVTGPAAFNTKRKAPFSENSEFECKAAKHGKLVQGHAIGAKETKAADMQDFERESGITGRRAL